MIQFLLSGIYPCIFFILDHSNESRDVFFLFRVPFWMRGFWWWDISGDTLNWNSWFSKKKSIFIFSIYILQLFVFGRSRDISKQHCFPLWRLLWYEGRTHTLVTLDMNKLKLSYYLIAYELLNLAHMKIHSQSHIEGFVEVGRGPC